MSHRLTFWTNDPEQAAWADYAGVDRIGVDLETIGKSERQSGLATWISPHSIDDLARVKAKLTKAALFVRVNPINDGFATQLEQVLSLGATIVMLPNFSTIDEVRAATRLANGRAEIVPLVERVAAIEIIPELPAAGVREFHVGLNDLSIDTKQSNRLALLATPLMEKIASYARDSNLLFGVGGLGRAFDDTLPTPSDLVYAQHVRLGSTGALLARSFLSDTMDQTTFRSEIAHLRQRLLEWEKASPEDLHAAKLQLIAATSLSSSP
jgi:citrate lyase beta subunit